MSYDPGDQYDQYADHDGYHDAAGAFGDSPSRFGQSGGAGSGRFGSPGPRRGPLAGAGTGAYGSSPKRYGMPYRVDRQRAWNMRMLQDKLAETEDTIESTRSRLLMARVAPQQQGGAGGYGVEADASGAGWGGGGGYQGGDGMYDDYEDSMQPEVDETKLAIREGWVKKKSRSRFTRKRWADKLLRVVGSQLQYFDKEEDYRPRAEIEIDELTEVEAGDSKGQHTNKDIVHTFTVRPSGEEEMVLACENEDEADRWVETIQYLIQAHKDVHDPEKRAARQRARQQQQGHAGFNPHMDPLSSMAALEAHKKEEADKAAAHKDLAMRHRAWGPGLSEAVLGEQATFTIQPDEEAMPQPQQNFDEYGNPLPADGDDEEPFTVSLSNADLEIELHPEDVGDGTLQVNYVPPKAGTFELCVKYKGQHIFGSPFLPEVRPAPTAPKHCVVTGEGAKFARLGQKNTFTVVARDQFDSPRNEGGDQFEILVHGPAVPYDIVDHGNGCYTVTYEVQLGPEDVQKAQRGIAPQIEVEVNMHAEGFFYARPIAGSPFLPQVLFTKEDMDAAMGPAAAQAPEPVASPPVSAAVSALSPEMQATLARAQALTAALAGTGLTGGPAPSSVGSFSAAHTPSSTVQSASQGFAASHSFDAASTWASTATTQAAPATSTTPVPPPPPTSQEAGAPPPPPSHLTATSASHTSEGSAALAAERAELEAAKADFARQMEELQAMRASIDRDRELVSSQLATMTQLGEKVKQDAHALASAASASPPPRRGGGPAGAAGSAPASTAVTPGGVPTLSSPPTRAPAAASGPSPAPAAPAPGGAADAGDAPAELFQPEVMALFDNFTKPLIKLFKFYADCGSGPSAGMTASAFLRLCKDYMVVPTFTSKSEVKSIFAATAVTHGLMQPGAKASTKDKTTALTFAAFTEAVGRMALVCLSRPAFASLYRTPRDKVLVVLEMWGLGDPKRLQQIKSTYAAQGAAAAAQQ